ncbi:hypothetical protein BKA56DRAFT_564310 [Ilyonectria sp. MPI-CAGE-AT-0026]|nr:hypothetical protein BKA56DRAFT_564310 [Ilyonectria sp. MPI-CAGE-AT-0026]
MVHKINKVALAGANGNLGSRILQALVQKGCFRVTLLARNELNDLPTGVTIKVVDFESGSALAEALKGQDALIDATSVPDPSVSIRMMDAAVAAGVHRMIPAEFSSDPMNSKSRALPPFQGKTKAFEHIQKLARDNKITWTAISNHAFLDWGLRMSFVGIDLGNKKIDYLNDGNMVVPWTTLTSVGIAVANALSKSEETKNRVCSICNIQKSQRELAGLAKQALGEEGWQTQERDTCCQSIQSILERDMNDAFDKAMSQLQAGQVNWQVIGDIILYSISTPGYIQKLEKTDNELLGVQAMSDEEVKGLVKEIAGEKKAA